MNDKRASRRSSLSPAKQALLDKLIRGKGPGFDTRETIPKRSSDDPSVLSFAQQRLWFLDQLAPGNPAYNVPAAFRLEGRLDVAVLERSLNEIVRRHEALRTLFIDAEGKPLQVVKPALELPLPVIDLRNRPPAARESEALRLSIAEARRPFDLSSAPLIRAVLLRLAEAEHILLLTLHHIVSDGWSLGVFSRELGTLYAAFVAGRPSPLPELPIQYGDFAQWQRQRLQGDALEEQVGYWKRQLAAIPPMLEIPTDGGRAATQTFDGGQRSLDLSPELTRKLKKLSLGEGVTLFMTLLAAFQTLLHRITRQDTIVVGSPIANRTGLAIEPLIGFFVNTLVLRADFSGKQSFVEFLARVRETSLAAYAHQDLPFEKLVEELQPGRYLTHSPLFQVMFQYRNEPKPTLELPGIRAEGLAIDNGVAKFDLTLCVTDEEEQLKATLEYNATLFSGLSIERWLRHFRRLLESLTADPYRAVTHLPLLEDDERRRLLVEWNRTQRDYPKDITVNGLFEAQAERTPDDTAVVFGDERMTYRELNARANRLAHRLKALSVGPESRVGICVKRSLDMVVGLLGILKAGGAYVPLDPAYPAERLAFICEDARLSVLLTQQKLIDDSRSKRESGDCGSPILDPRLQVICIDSDRDTIERQSGSNLSSGADPESLAYIIYTSGSTGRPKGVAITHRSAVAFLTWAAGVYRPDELAGVLASTSICFDLSIFELFLPLTSGGKVIVAGTILDLPALPAAREVTLINTVPSAIAELLRLEGIPATVRTINLAGEPLSPSLVTQLYEKTGVGRVYDLYGPSEDTTYSTYALRRSDGPATIGRPIANTQIYLLDTNLCPVPIGVAGEIHIGGDGLARGYLDRPDLTAERFIPNPFSENPGTRLYRTGDLARYLPDGDIEFLGRLDHQVKIRGFRIELGEIEAVLRTHPGVQDVIVLAREDVPSSKQLVAYLSRGQEQLPNHGALVEFLRQKLPAYMVPSAFVTLESLPLTPNGKIDRRALPMPDNARPLLAAAFEAPRSPMEAAMAEIWAEILRLTQVGVHDNFFELGGHSLLATQLISRIRGAFRTELPLSRLFEAPTVAGLTQSVEQARKESRGLEVPPIRPIAREGPTPLSFSQERLWFLDRWEPGSAYNVTAAFRLDGPLDAAALERSLNEIVRRHEALRTLFIDSEGKPLQVVKPALALPMPVIDLRDHPPAERESDALQLSIAEARRPFDLSRGPLIRAALLRLGEAEHVLLVTVHHIVSDGWSLGVLSRELGALYTAFVSGRPSPLLELPIQYGDFAHWQREWLQGDALDAQLDYWRRQLAGISDLDLPLDRPRPRIQRYHGANQTVVLPKELNENLKGLARRQGATLFMTLLAAFKTLLHGHTGQDDIVVGCPIANRNRAEIEGLIGFFLNTLVLRTDLSGNPTFVEVLERVRDTALGAYAHQDLPFEKLLEELQPRRDTSRPPLVQVLFNFFNFVDKPLELSGLVLHPIAIDDGHAAKFDLTLYLEERDSGLAVTANYNTDLFEAATIAAMLGHFQNLLEEIVREPARRIATLPFLSEAERRRRTSPKPRVGPVNPFAVFEKEEIEQSIADRFAKQVRRFPYRVAVKTEQTAWTYEALNRSANHIARRLLEVCRQGEERVALLFDHGAPMIMGLLGVLKAGKAYVPLDPSHPESRLIYMLDELEAETIVTDANGMTLAQDLKRDGRRLIDIGGLPADLDGEDVSVTVAPESLAYILYTSGSTGQPKGVMQSHRNVLHHIRSYTNSLHIHPEDRLTLLSSYGFDAAVMDIFGALLNGATLYPIDIKDRAPLEIVRWCLKERITIYHSTPTVYRYIAGALAEEETLPDVRLVVLGGEEATQRDVDAYKTHFSDSCLFVNGFGPTESTVTLQYFLDKRTEVVRHSVPIGFPADETDVWLLDAAGRPAAIVGEIMVRSSYVALGYWRRPELADGPFRPDPAKPGTRIYRTGDVGRMRADGSIEFVRRKDDQVKIRGFRIELGEVETALAQYPGIKETVVVAREEDHPGPSTGLSAGKWLAAYVVPRQGAAPSAAALRGFLKERLPEYMVPAAFVILESLPLLRNGKIDRQALPAPDSTGRQIEGSFVAPRTPVEETLAKIWSELLHVERVGIHDNFFDLGGHSLLAMRVTSRVQEIFHADFPLRVFFQGPTVAQMAESLAAIRWVLQNGQDSGKKAGLGEWREV